MNKIDEFLEGLNDMKQAKTIADFEYLGNKKNIIHYVSITPLKSVDNITIFVREEK